MYMYSHPWAHKVPTNDLQSLFAFCNARYFGNALTPSPGFKLRFSRSVKRFGCFTYCLESHTDWGIEISHRLQDHPVAMLSTLVHEMIHMLAYQRYRETGDRSYLDERPRQGHAFVNPGHGAFFLNQLKRLNRAFRELRIAVKNDFGDPALYDLNKIRPEKLLLVTISRERGKGMIYRLHQKSGIDWNQLRETALQVHNCADITLLQVGGHLAEGFPCLRRDDAPRKNMKPRSLRHFTSTAKTLRQAPGTVILHPFESRTATSQKILDSVG